jgi:hypothetical protein
MALAKKWDRRPSKIKWEQWANKPSKSSSLQGERTGMNQSSGSNQSSAPRPVTHIKLRSGRVDPEEGRPCRQGHDHWNGMALAVCLIAGSAAVSRPT